MQWIWSEFLKSLMKTQVDCARWSVVYWQEKSFDFIQCFISLSWKTLALWEWNEKKKCFELFKNDSIVLKGNFPEDFTDDLLIFELVTSYLSSGRTVKMNVIYILAYSLRGPFMFYIWSPSSLLDVSKYPFTQNRIWF